MKLFLLLIFLTGNLCYAQGEQEAYRRAGEAACYQSGVCQQLEDLQIRLQEKYLNDGLKQMAMAIVFVFKASLDSQIVLRWNWD